MKNLKVTKVNSESIEFENGVKLGSDHETDCCEDHYLCFKDLTLEDFKGLKFNLEFDDFFNKIEGYGIELIPIKGHSVRVPGYGSNNGYYSDDLSLTLTADNFSKSFDVTECQVIED